MFVEIVVLGPSHNLSRRSIILVPSVKLSIQFLSSTKDYGILYKNFCDWVVLHFIEHQSNCSLFPKRFQEIYRLVSTLSLKKLVPHFSLFLINFGGPMLPTSVYKNMKIELRGD